jgi:WD40 repeat protein
MIRSTIAATAAASLALLCLADSAAFRSGVTSPRHHRHAATRRLRPATRKPVLPPTPPLAAPQAPPPTPPVSSIGLILLRTLTGPDAPDAYSDRFSADGSRIAIAAEDHTIRIWNVADGGLLQTIRGQCGSTGAQVSFTPDGRTIASVLDDRRIGLYDVETGRMVKTLGSARYYNGIYAPLDVAPRSPLVAVAAAPENIVQIFDAGTGASRSLVSDFHDVVRCLQFSPSGYRLAAGSADGSVRVWRVSDGAVEFDPVQNAAPVECVAFSPDGAILASAGEDRVVRLTALRPGGTTRTLGFTPEKICALAFSPDGRVLVAGTNPGIRVWRVSDGAPIASLNPQGDWITAVSFSPSGSLLATASRGERNVKLWQVILR